MDSVVRPEELKAVPLPAALQAIAWSTERPPLLQFTGRIAHQLFNWKKISLDPWILECVMGYKIAFIKAPVQKCIPVARASGEMQALISAEVETLLGKGAIREVEHLGTKEGFFSRIFVIPKKGGQFRLVVNLRPLNRFIEYQHFKLESIHLVRDLLQLGDWMVRLDLKDAYFAVPIWSGHRKYLRFKWDGRAFEFKCLPFGLSSAPLVFTKLLRPVVGFLRDKGVRCIIYIDDVLIMHQSKELAWNHMVLAVEVLEGLGFLVNYKKSQIKPSQEIEFLGFKIVSTKMELKLPREKLVRIQKEAKHMLDQGTVSARQLAQLIGRMLAAILAIQPAPLHYRGLQWLKHRALKARGYDGMVLLSGEAREDLAWWTRNLVSWNGRVTEQRTPTMTIETDASMRGWGAFCQGTAAGGCWSPEERAYHINVLELLAVYYALKAFIKSNHFHPQLVMILSDNTSAVSHINKMGGTRSQQLVSLARTVWEWCLLHQITLQAQHLPGVLNWTADFLSRHLTDRSDWILEEQVFTVLNRWWGPLDVDLFATRFSARLPRFYSWKPDPEAEATDAFVQQWRSIQGFAHPHGVSSSESSGRYSWRRQQWS